jgi:hypothetical protein
MVGKLTPDTLISASRIAVLMGVSPYETPNELMRSILDARQGKPRQWLEQNEPMFWGDTLEGVILTEAAKRLSLTHLETEFDEAIFHDHLPFACSLDGQALGGKTFTHDPANGIYVPQGGSVDTTGLGVLEAKVTANAAEDVPAPHRGPMQLQGQLMCTGYAWGAVCVLYRGNELRIFLYRVDDAMRDDIIDAIHEFERRKRDIDWYEVYTSADGNVAWDRVDDGAPPLDLNEIEDGEFYAEMLVQAKADKKAAEQQIDIAEAGLKEILGNHEEGSVTVDGSSFYIKWPMRRSRAQPSKTVPAKPESVTRQKTLTVKEVRQ